MSTCIGHAAGTTISIVQYLYCAFMNLVYYSMASDGSGRCERQWTQSIRSLRRYNPSIPVHLFVYGSCRKTSSKKRDGATSPSTCFDYTSAFARRLPHGMPLSTITVLFTSSTPSTICLTRVDPRSYTPTAIPFSLQTLRACWSATPTLSGTHAKNRGRPEVLTGINQNILMRIALRALPMRKD